MFERRMCDCQPRIVDTRSRIWQGRNRSIGFLVEEVSWDGLKTGPCRWEFGSRSWVNTLCGTSLRVDVGVRIGLDDLMQQEVATSRQC